jgi:hypothetical protein
VTPARADPEPGDDRRIRQIRVAVAIATAPVLLGLSTKTGC